MLGQIGNACNAINGWKTIDKKTVFKICHNYVAEIKPRPGDILVFNRTKKCSTGHIAIIASVSQGDKGNINFVQQN